MAATKFVVSGNNFVTRGLPAVGCLSAFTTACPHANAVIRDRAVLACGAGGRGAVVRRRGYGAGVAEALAPPGWPRGLAPPGAPSWEQAAVSWLLDQCPADYRAHEVLRRHPVVLARFAAHHVDASLAGARSAYASARRELGDQVAPEVVDAALRALEAEGARLARAAREVALVEEALQGHRWKQKL
jgi:hypothetical protein